MKPFLLRVLVLLSGMATAGPVGASTFSVRVDSPFLTGGPYAVFDSGPDEAEASNSLGGNHIWQASGYAGPGVLRGYTDAWSAGDHLYLGMAATSGAQAWFDDLHVRWE